MNKIYKKIISSLIILLIVSFLGITLLYYVIGSYSNYINDIDNKKGFSKNNHNQLIKKELKTINKEEQKLVIVSVIPQAEFVEKIGKEKLITITMIPPGSNHNYDPSPKQLENLSKAKIYFMLNCGEPFEEKYMETFKQLNSKMKIINCSENIPLIIINGKKDPHIWLSPKMAIIIIENIFEGLVNIDPINYEYYETNKDVYILELKNLDKKIEQILLPKEKKIFIVYHPAWGYFSRDYNLIQIPIEIEGKEPTSKSMEKLIIEAKKNNIKVVFVQEQISKQVAESISLELGGTVISLNPLAKNYIENMEYMVNIIAENMN